MSTNTTSGLLSVEEYLAGERASTSQKREFIEGVVYSCPDASERHNLIASNTTISLGLQLRGKAERVFGSDTKIRIRLTHGTRFYYPDSMIVRRLNDPDGRFQDNPVLIVEVLSSITRRIDEVEKLDSYRAIESLEVYVLIEQSQAQVTVHRRVDGAFVRESYSGLEAAIPLPELNISLPLAEIYESISY
jgi:Uma2 family endonuclease